MANLHSTHWNKGFTPQTPENDENDESGGRHSGKGMVYKTPGLLFLDPSKFARIFRALSGKGKEKRIFAF